MLSCLPARLTVVKPKLLKCERKSSFGVLGGHQMVSHVIITTSGLQAGRPRFLFSQGQTKQDAIRFVIKQTKRHVAKSLCVQ